MRNLKRCVTFFCILTMFMSACGKKNVVVNNVPTPPISTNKKTPTNPPPDSPSPTPPPSLDPKIVDEQKTADKNQQDMSYLYVGAGFVAGGLFGVANHYFQNRRHQHVVNNLNNQIKIANQNNAQYKTDLATINDITKTQEKQLRTAKQTNERLLNEKQNLKNDYNDIYENTQELCEHNAQLSNAYYVLEELNEQLKNENKQIKNQMALDDTFHKGKAAQNKKTIIQQQESIKQLNNQISFLQHTQELIFPSSERPLFRLPAHPPRTHILAITTPPQSIETPNTDQLETKELDTPIQNEQNSTLAAQETEEEEDKNEEPSETRFNTKDNFEEDFSI